MELNDRKLKILQAVVADFINSAEPIGSRTLSKRDDIDVSPATIRNEMSDLEEMGYLTHPHTSAGRVPSDKAYRLYVDELMSHSELSPEEKEVIKEKLDQGSEELDRTLEHASKVLSEMTNLVSFAVTPKEENKIKYINFLPVDETSVVLMIVCENGRVSNTAIRVGCPYTEENLTLMSKVATHNYSGQSVSNILTQDIMEEFERDLPQLTGMSSSVVPGFIKTLEKMLDVDLYVNGYKNVFALPEFNDVEKVKDVYDIVTNKDQFSQVLVNRDNGLVVTIGDENSPDLKDFALITADYRVNGKMVGRLGVLGPKRMKYDEVTSVIKYITDNMNNTFEIEGEVQDE
ncbi:MAG: heat-inducible transcription repressor HrcA [Firmicutes bacterium]|nr:heat-inducible transcription repressor HrcA [Bacillota bacterium]